MTTDSSPPSRPVGLILLAAGESRRMGRAKQLLPFAGTTLLRHACKVALAARVQPIVVVLGANHEECAREITDLPLTWILNSLWANGMSGSLRVALSRLMEAETHCAGALVMLTDQPLLTPDDLRALLSAWDPPNRPIAAAAYEGTLGVPAIFARSLFGELTALHGREGARTVIARHRAATASVSIPAAARDVDTFEEYEQLLQDEEKGHGGAP